MCETGDYDRANRRIMLVGQESLRWLGEVNDGVFNHENISVRLMKLYHQFVNHGGYNSPVWNFYRKLSDVAKKNYYFYITNTIIAAL